MYYVYVMCVFVYVLDQPLTDVRHIAKKSDEGEEGLRDILWTTTAN